VSLILQVIGMLHMLLEPVWDNVPTVSSDATCNIALTSFARKPKSMQQALRLYRCANSHHTYIFILRLGLRLAASLGDLLRYVPLIGCDLILFRNGHSSMRSHRITEHCVGKNGSTLSKTYIRGRLLGKVSNIHTSKVPC
jgi:hypothetical protein